MNKKIQDCNKSDCIVVKLISNLKKNVVIIRFICFMTKMSFGANMIGLMLRHLIRIEGPRLQDCQTALE